MAKTDQGAIRTNIASFIVLAQSRKTGNDLPEVRPFS